MSSLHRHRSEVLRSSIFRFAPRKRVYIPPRHCLSMEINVVEVQLQHYTFLPEARSESLSSQKSTEVEYILVISDKHHMMLAT